MLIKEIGSVILGADIGVYDQILTLEAWLKRTLSLRTDLILHGDYSEKWERYSSWRALLVDPQPHPAQYDKEYWWNEQIQYMIIYLPTKYKYHTRTAVCPCNERTQLLKQLKFK